jgi:hypothetical protein
MRRRRALLLAGLLLALSAGARIYRLEADPPREIVRGYQTHTHFRDEPAKAHEARNRALFGRWRLGDVDQYGLWARPSPVWAYGQYLWFSLFGVSWASARLYVVAYAVAGLALLYGLVATHYGLLAAAAATILLSFNFAYLEYTRLGLMEAAVIFWVLAATCALAAARRHARHRRWLVPVAGLGLVAACLAKPTGLAFVPLVAGAMLNVASAPPAGGPARREWGRSLVRTAEGRIALGTLGAVVLALAANLADPAYSEPIAFQVREHVTRPMHASLVFALGRGIVASLTGPKIPAMLAYLAPVAWGLALAEIGRAALAARRGAGPDAPRTGAPVDVLALRAAPDPLARYMMGWLASIVALNLLTSKHLVHVQLMLLPAVAFLGGLFAARLWHAAAGPQARRPWLHRGVVVLAAGVFLTYHGIRYSVWTAHAGFTFRDSSRTLTRLIGPREAVVVGEYAAHATLATPYRHYYIRPGQFNDAASTLRALGITHLVTHDGDMAAEALRRNAPELLAGARPIGQLDFYGIRLTVYELR